MCEPPIFVCILRVGLPSFGFMSRAGAGPGLLCSGIPVQGLLRSGLPVRFSDFGFSDFPYRAVKVVVVGGAGVHKVTPISGNLPLVTLM